jgi:hypothetical protein
MSVSEIYGSASFAEAEDWRAIAILEAAHKYGALTKGEAVCRVGENAASVSLKKLVDQGLLMPIAGGVASEARKVYGLSDRAKRLFGEGKEAKELLEAPKFRRGR